MTPRRSILAACVAALPLVVAGCGGGGRIGKVGDVRLVNATTVTDYASLDLYSGDARIASAVGNDGASGYAEVDAGTRALSLRLADGGAQLASATAEVTKDAHTTVLAYVAAGAPSMVVLGDDESVPSGGSAKVRVFNAAAAEAGTLSAYLSATGCSTLGASNAIATGVTAAAVGAWATVGAAAAGTRYHLCVAAAGDSADLRLDLPSFTLTSRQVTTVVLTGTPGGVLVNALAVDQQGATSALRNPSARVRVVVDTADKAPVSATVNAVGLESATPSPSVGVYALLPAGALTTVLRLGTTAVTAPVRTAQPGADLTLLVAGSAAAPAVSWLDDDNRPSTATASPVRLRLVHGVNGSSSSLTLRANARTVASGVGFGSASAPANVAAGSLPLAVTAAGASTALYATTSTTAAALESGGVYTLFMLGASDAAADGVLQRDR